ncbi:MAG: hypothetical protein IJD21_06190 [Oscillospiraceae bacterium]|nr:hypothetical protein [Oscillospiraceae bacterium]
MKYMVMECGTSYAVVLDEEGQFRNVVNRGYQVGQTVTQVFPLPELQKPEKSGSRTLIRTLTSLAACLALVITAFFHFQSVPFASVYLSINPEVRIDIDRHDTVVGLAGVNEDGANLIAEYDFQRKHLDLVMDELVDLAIEMGYLHEGGTITLMLDGNNEWIVTHGDQLSHHLQDYMTQKLSVTIEVGAKGSESDYGAVYHDIAIPVYGESDYGESNYDDDDQDDGASGYDDDDRDDGASGYDDDDRDDGITDYDSDSDVDSSGYDSDQDDDDRDDSASAYDDDDRNDGITDYDSDNDDDSSGYDSDQDDDGDDDDDDD